MDKNKPAQPDEKPVPDEKPEIRPINPEPTPSIPGDPKPGTMPQEDPGQAVPSDIPVP